MNLDLNLKKVSENLALLFVAAFVGLLVSAVAQGFMLAAKNLFNFIFNLD